MDNLDQIFEEWKDLLQEPLPSHIESSHFINTSIMKTFIDYETKVNASRATSFKALLILGICILFALLVYSLLTCFRGQDAVTYNLSEMVIGTFLILTGIGIMAIHIKKITFPDINDLATKDYLLGTRKTLLEWKYREIPAFFLFIILIPTGVSLLLKSVFLIPFTYIFMPFLLLYLCAFIVSYYKNNPEFKRVLNEVDFLLEDFIVSN